MTENVEVAQRDGFVEYPKMAFPPNGVDKPVVVQNEEEWQQYKAKGWLEKPYEFTEIGMLKANIAYHEGEYIRLRQELAELESRPEPVVEPKVEFVEVPMGGASPIELAKVEEQVETKPNPFVPRRVRKV